MARETTTILLNCKMSREEVEALYDAERKKAALIHPILEFQETDDRSFQVSFGTKHRTWTGIEKYKPLIELAIRKKYPDCRVS